MRKQSRGSVFVLSDKFLTLATPVAGEPAFVETALPFMRELRDTTQETVLAGVLVGNEGVVLEQCEGLHPFSFRISTGLRFSLHTAAPGKLFLAHLETKKRSKLINSLKLKKLTPIQLSPKKIWNKRYYLPLRMGLRLIMRRNSRGKSVWVLPCLEKMPGWLVPYGWSHPLAGCQIKILPKLPKR